jgi:hypothetical protein
METKHVFNFKWLLTLGDVFVPQKGALVCSRCRLGGSFQVGLARRTLFSLDVGWVPTIPSTM